MYEGLVYIDIKRGYYARWSRTLRIRTNIFDSSIPLDEYWIELIRTEPESIPFDDA